MPRSELSNSASVWDRYRHKGLEVMLIHESYERSVKKVYRRSEPSWQLEDKRAMDRSNIEAAGATLYKPNRAYQKDL